MSGEAVLNWPTGSDGKPCAMISVAASEKIPTVQYGNVDVGPISVTRFISSDGSFADGLDEAALLKAISNTQTSCEKAVAEERKSIQVLMRARADRSA